MHIYLFCYFPALEAPTSASRLLIFFYSTVESTTDWRYFSIDRLLFEACAFEGDNMLTNYVKIFSTGTLSYRQIGHKAAVTRRLRCFATGQAIKYPSSRKLSFNLVPPKELSVRRSSSSGSSGRATGLDIVSPLIGLTGAIWEIIMWMHKNVERHFTCSQNTVRMQFLNNVQICNVRMLTNLFLNQLLDDQESFYTLAKDFSDKEMKPFAGL